jgi:Uma2 family endonuclease
MEVYKMLPEGTLAELINGQIFMSPAPSNQHQRILKSIFKVLDDFIEFSSLGEVFIAPSDVYLDDSRNAVQPDLYFISSQNKMLVLDDQPNQGIPDLIIEILSPGNNKHDLIIKKELYEKFDVCEYWIVDPATKEAIVYQLKNNLYVMAGKEIAKISSPLLKHVFEF